MKKSLKNLLAALCLAGLAAAPITANIEAVNPENLPQDKKFTEQYEVFKDNVNYISPMGIIPDSGKNAETVEKQIKDLLKSTLEVKKPSVDVQLLSFFCQTMLYNLNACSATDIDSSFKKLVKKFPKEYRTYWLYGNYKSTAVAEPDNLSYFEQAEKLAESPENIPAGFYYNYAYACIMLKNTFKARELLKVFSEKTKQPLEDIQLYKAVNDMIHEPVSKGVYKSDDVWQYTKLGKNYYVFNTLLGFSFIPEPEFPIRTMDISNNKALFSVKYQNKFESNGNSIGTSLLNQAFIGKMTDGLIDKETNKLLKGFTVDTSYTKTINGVEYTIYEASSSTVLNTPVQKGGKTFIAVATIPYEADKEVEIQKPVSPSKSIVYSRIKEDITWIIYLPACKAIEKEAKKTFDKILENTILR